MQMPMDNLPKIVVITGPTATGKSDLAVKMAKIFDGEVISADSRQVYKGLDIGTGKMTKSEMGDVRHLLLDIAEPSNRFTVVQWKAAAEKAIREILSCGKLPIIAGGTGYYISSLVDNKVFPGVESNPDEQARLELKSNTELMDELKQLDPLRADSMSSKSESSNKRRLARAILVARELGTRPDLHRDESKNRRYPTSPISPIIEALQIGITVPDSELKQRIRDRLIRRIDDGMIEEAQELNKKGLSFERMDELGLEYRYLAQYLQGKISKEQLIEILSTKIWQFAKRQKTWFKRDKRIEWFAPTDTDAISKKMSEFLRN